MAIVQPEETPEDYIYNFNLFKIKQNKLTNFVEIQQNNFISIMVKHNDSWILVEQERYGIKEKCIEPICGVIDDGEDPKDCAIRETQEESGHIIQTITPHGWAYVNPGMNNNKMYYFTAQTDGNPAGQQNLDENEVLEVIYSKTIPPFNSALLQKYNFMDLA